MKKHEEVFIFKAKAMNLEFIDFGNEEFEIRPIHKQKNTKYTEYRG